VSDSLLRNCTDTKWKDTA